MAITKTTVEGAFRRAFLAEGVRLREEDHQKVEELVPLLAELDRLLPKRGGLTVVDACAGKSAVGVLLAALVFPARKRPSRVLAIEREPARATLFSRAAHALGVAGAATIATGDVADGSLWPSEPDLVVALHACGAASDAILDSAIAARAKQLLVVPCCYGAAPVGAREDVPGQTIARAWAARTPLPAHALVGRRFAQALIDAERTLRLEAAGYHTDVVELLPGTVTPYALAWRARRVCEATRQARAQAQLAALRAGPLA